MMRRSTAMGPLAAALIYGLALSCASGAQAQPPEPLGVTAWGGYHQSIRLTWFPPPGEAPEGAEAGALAADYSRNGVRLPLSGESPASRSRDLWSAASADPARAAGAVSGSRTYRVRRSTSADGVFSIIADDVTSAWYRDDDVVNGREYFYTVSTVQDGLESAPSEISSARARRDGNLVRSGFTQSAPAIDGFIGADEWQRAAAVDITAPYDPALDAVTAFVMNSATHLYIAVRDPNIPFPDEFNQIGIYFEQRRSGQWNDPPGTPEGNIWVIYDSNFDETWNWFRAIRGDWPDVGFVQFGGVGSVQQELGFLSGAHEYEVAIDLAIVPLVSGPGRVVSLGLFSDQTGDAPFSGDWPGGIFASAEYFAAPILYGDVALASADGARAVLPEEIAGGASLVVVPNPVRERATFRARLPRAGDAIAALGIGAGAAAVPEVAIYDAAGRRVACARLDPSASEWHWDGRDAAGAQAPTGVYFFKLEGSSGASGRMLLLR